MLDGKQNVSANVLGKEPGLVPAQDCSVRAHEKLLEIPRDPAGKIWRRGLQELVQRGDTARRVVHPKLVHQQEAGAKLLPRKRADLLVTTGDDTRNRQTPVSKRSGNRQGACASMGRDESSNNSKSQSEHVPSWLLVSELIARGRNDLKSRRLELVVKGDKSFVLRRQLRLGVKQEGDRRSVRTGRQTVKQAPGRLTIGSRERTAQYEATLTNRETFPVKYDRDFALPSLTTTTS
jgi:hypothetical protein